MDVITEDVNSGKTMEVPVNALANLVMSQDLGRWHPNKEALDLMRRTVANDLNEDQFALFLHVCKRTGLDPIARQIYGLIRRAKNKAGQYEERLSIQTSIDGFRLIAQRTGQYLGQTKVEWLNSNNEWQDYWVEGRPLGARVGVWRTGFKEPVYAFARYASYVAEGPMWPKMPEVMIAKCAEALALRKAFPQELGGIYTDDEMEQADHPVQAEVLGQPKPLDMRKPLTPAAKTQGERNAAAYSTKADPRGTPPTSAGSSARERLAKMAERAQVSGRPNTNAKQERPGDYVIPGNSKVSGMMVRELDGKRVLWLAENSQNPILKLKCHAHLLELVAGMDAENLGALIIECKLADVLSAAEARWTELREQEQTQVGPLETSTSFEGEEEVM